LNPRAPGQFRPTAAANPTIGHPGELEYVEEDRVEVLVLDRMREVVQALKAVGYASTYSSLGIMRSEGTSVRGGRIRCLQAGGLLTMSAFSCQTRGNYAPVSRILVF
jgi:hypothetical protein